MPAHQHVTLNHEEIETSIQNYVRSQINVADNQDIVIDLKAGRGENGFSANLDIVPANMAKSVTITADTVEVPSKAKTPEPKPTKQATKAKPSTFKEEDAVAAISSTPEDRKEPEEKEEKVAKPSFNLTAKAGGAEGTITATPIEEEADDAGSSLDDRGNSMTGETQEDAGDQDSPAPAKGIFSKVNNG